MSDIMSDLSGKFLIAMPGMGDTRFSQSVVYVCAHSEDGAMGLIVNKPTPEVRFSDLLTQLEIDAQPGMRDIRVHFGGPVENSRGFVLHSADYKSGESTLMVNDEMGLTATLDVLEEIAQGRGPKSSFLALGYSGWGPGQLESEIAQNGWLTSDARSDIVFGRANEHKWMAAVKSLGIDPVTLSATSGRA
ncbi:YqgE/AlgH family protein [Ponticoccus sp. SC2-23]|nr:YqgE/AlgH family protein [Ponticoccus sp. SC6-9]MBM1225025.1 YqgE/AlgH family protein [Ponticoccus sp. SC6-15]MBM1228539.1 YqgE/AlgH family protein [Ponticoccus sp. SC6-38]MBM1233824.1 YqgE/AlgH family protein [Ponticoccus sp. SC6-45]MBM1239040.1 YqgE/AlgH family protein [Ponticoccus sp. SC6-49]MBM1242822.1 YqgE/AlgH family protein [Ponticoccus sp. SC2-64]MBM1247348.1 YqgE/AlgH family protein [Ponticoccus sp. SC6-42]MBM1251993.1 YqgE/AlgH family protein [Ponticoccus sp. SC6-33]MBM1257049